jgi:hypothetical protein
VDEILLARVMEQKSESVYTHGQYLDEESTGVENEDDFNEEEETEYDTRKGRPAIL